MCAQPDADAMLMRCWCMAGWRCVGADQAQGAGRDEHPYHQGRILTAKWCEQRQVQYNLMGDGRKWCGNGVESNNSNPITLWHGFLKEHLRVFSSTDPLLPRSTGVLGMWIYGSAPSRRAAQGFLRRKLGPSWAQVSLHNYIILYRSNSCSLQSFWLRYDILWYSMLFNGFLPWYSPSQSWYHFMKMLPACTHKDWYMDNIYPELRVRSLENRKGEDSGDIWMDNLYGCHKTEFVYCPMLLFFGSIWPYFVIFGIIWWYWQPLLIFGTIWEYMAIFGNLC